jgi:hypothetical protein
MSRSFLASLALLLVFAACKGSPTEPKFSDAILTGTVTFLETGAPVADARVTAYLVQIKGYANAETRTDAAGRYFLTGFPGGQYSVAVYAPGADRAAWIDQYDLGPGTNTVNVQISASGCVTMSGRVYDVVTRAGISGAAITFLGQHVVSGADGSYALNLGCPPHPAGPSETITLEHPNYQRREYLISVPTFSTTSDIMMQPR